MNKRASLVQAIQNAGTFADQALAVSALDNYDRMRREAAQQSREWDAAGAIVEQTLTPVSVYERHTAATDWIGDLDTSGGNYHADMCAEASVWYGKVHPMVKADADEFAAQARGMARRTAGKYGESFDAAAQTFLDYAAYLRSKEAASGLPQIDQEFDPKDNPSETPLPTEVFDTFQPPVHPVNEGVDGPRDDSPLIDEIMANPGYGQGPEKPGGHSISFDESGSYAEVPLGEPGKIPTTAALEYDDHRPSLAIGYTTNLDDIQSELRSGLDFPERRTAMRKGAPFAGYADFEACVAANSDKDDPEAYCGSIKHKVEGASSLPTQHQTVDPNNTPTPQADTFNTEVAFPLNPAFEKQVDTEELPPAENVAQAKRRAYVAGLLTRAPQTWDATERAEVAAYLTKAAGLTKRADEFSAPHNVPGEETPVSNSPQTTPQPASGSYGKGQSDGAADKAAGEAPTFSDASSGVSDYVRGYSEAYGGQEAAGSPDVPASMGGDAGQPQNASDAQGAAQTAMAAKTARDYSESERKQMADKGQARPDGSFPIKDKADLANAKHDIGRADDPAAAKRWINERADALGAPGVGEDKKASLLPQLVREASMSTPDFIKGFNFARRWKPGQRLVSTGSAEFEEGLYAGITENRVAQASWVVAHRKEARRLSAPQLMKRISAHERATRRFARRNPSALVRGFYVQAATSTDLITLGPGTSPDPMGGTPINGPGTPPPMEGGTNPARPGGPAPYNGAPPYGAGPVAPDPVVGQQQTSSPVTSDNELPGYPSAEQRQAAFKTVVQANLNKIKQEA